MHTDGTSAVQGDEAQCRPIADRADPRDTRRCVKVGGVTLLGHAVTRCHGATDAFPGSSAAPRTRSCCQPRSALRALETFMNTESWPSMPVPLKALRK
jgi:hypothetical protein